MSSESLHARAREVFLGATSRAEGERAHYVDEACGEDEELRREVEALLGYHTDDDSGAVSDPLGSRPRFASGDRVGHRYEILELIGSGGMGEIYRAQDHSLGTEVALKSLRRRQAPGGRQGLVREVRLAREITHPAVCRVHDLIEDGGELLLSMEYVRGEDLGKLLRRVGRLPPERALALARQLSSGLAAAHAKKVLHRDLKPGNVLIDESGDVRIADFGIASSPEDGTARVDSGTPEYMAPELLVPGAKATESSDLYSLGLVLYELTTGVRPFERAAVDGGRLFRRSAPVRPLRLVPGIDPGLERAISLSLEPDPADRPESALALTALLPGAHPLELAAEIGVTPSPRVVAAAPTGPLARLRLSWLWVMLIPLLIVLVLASDRSARLDRAGVTKAPAALADRADEMLRGFGYESPAGGPRFGYLHHPQSRTPDESLLFWYRLPVERWLADSTRALLLARPGNLSPAPAVGRLVALLDQKGHLVHLTADPTPPELAPAPEPDWEAVLRLAGLSSNQLETVAPGPLATHADAGRAWRRRSADFPGSRVEAASLSGRLVYFARDATSHPSPAPDQRPAAPSILSSAAILVAVALLIAALPLAYLNLRKGRGDRRGANRLVIAMLTALALSLLLTGVAPAHPLDGRAETLSIWLTAALLHGPWLWFGYLAVEPFARRVWPQTLIGWSRLLSGRFGDSAVGRSLLLGVVAGSCLALLDFARGRLGAWAGGAPRWDAAQALVSSTDARHMMATALAGLPLIVYNAILALLLLVLLRRITRSPTWAVAGFVAIWGVLVALASGSPLVLSLVLVGLPSAAIFALLLVRYGLLTFVVAWYTANLTRLYPITSEMDRWYAPATLFVLALIAGVAALGTWSAGRARRPTTDQTPDGESGA